MARKHEPLEVVDSSGLTDDDWAKINRLRHLHESGGFKAVSKAFDELAEADPIIFAHIMSAFFVDMVRETINATRPQGEERLAECPPDAGRRNTRAAASAPRTGAVLARLYAGQKILSMFVNFTLMLALA
jgi:hypothetical protein